MVSAVRSNPVINRHLATTFTGPRLGAAFLLVGGALFAVYAAIFSESMSYAMPDGLTYIAHNGVLLGLLILLLPLKVTGIIEGARINKSFDQVVATGVRPASLYWGAWFSGLVYAALLIFVTLPFAACLVTFSNADVWTLVKGYAVLFVYSNVILGVTLAGSTFGRDWVSTPIAIVLLITISSFSFIPDRDWVQHYPTILAELSPIRVLIEQAGATNQSFHPVLNSPPAVFLIWELPIWAVRIGLWALLCAIFAVIFTIGPGHVFRPGLDNFGAVVLKGDRKRGVMTWLRSGLTRRVELAFFYENAAKWTGRWGYPIRYALGAFPFVFGLGLLVAAIWATPRRGLPVTIQPSRWDFYNDWRGPMSIWLGGGMLAIWALLTVSSRRNGLTSRPVGRGSMTTESMYFLVFLGLLGGLTLFEFTPIWNLQMPTMPLAPLVKGQPPPTPEGYLAAWHEHFLGMLLLVSNVFLLARLASRLTDSVILSRIYGVLFVGVFCAAPSLVYAMIVEGVGPTTLAPLAYPSPAMLVPQSQFRDVQVPGHGFEEFALAHGGLLVALMGLLSLRYLAKLFRRGSSAAVAAAMLLCLAAAVPAQESGPGSGFAREEASTSGPLRFEVLARGFDGVVFDHQVDFYYVEIENTSNATVHVRYYVETRRENWGHGECVLSPKSSRIVRWNNAPRSTGQQLFGRWGDTRVVFEGGGQRLRSKPLDLTLTSSRSTRVNKGTQQTEQHLLVGLPGAFAQPWIDRAFAGNSTNLVACKPQHLPVSPRSYSGAEVVWMTAAALVDMDRRQRQALYHYAMMGGTVLFYGALPGAELAAAGVWGRLLKPVEQSVTDRGGKQLRHIRLAESADVEIATNKAGAKSAVASLRGLGAGFVGHVAFSPIRSRMPEDIATSKWFWMEFDRLIPRGGFPFLTSGLSDEWLDSDYTMLGVLAGYYLIYALLISVGLFLFARRRSQRRRMWTMVFALPILFIGFVPILVAASRSMPSLGEYAEIALYQSGSTEGLSAQHVRLHSAGRQSHRLEIAGSSPRAFASTDRYRRYFYRGTRMARLAEIPVESADAGFEIEYSVAPWSSGELFLVDSKRMAEAVTGSVQSRPKGFYFRVQIPVSLRGRRIYAVVQRNNSTVTRPMRVAGDGSATAKVLSKGQNNNYYGNRLIVQRQFGFASREKYGGLARGGMLVRAYVAIEPVEGESRTRPIKTADVEFEREISARMAERSTLRKQGGRRRGVFRHVRQVGSRYIETLDHRLLLIELPVQR